MTYLKNLEKNILVMLLCLTSFGNNVIYNIFKLMSLLRIDKVIISILPYFTVNNINGLSYYHHAHFDVVVPLFVEAHTF